MQDLTPQLARIVRDEAFRNTLGEGAYVLDEDGRLVDMNPAAERLLGWSCEELRGRNMHGAIHFLRPDGRTLPEAECPLLGVLRSGAHFAETHDVFVRKDASVLHVAYVSSPVLVDERIVGAVLAFWPRSAG
jgi:PAS domain S-box-containing protein